MSKKATKEAAEQRLPIKVILEKLEITDNWELCADTLKKDFEFKDFTKAIAFVNLIIPAINAINHHPDIRIHNYNKVEVTTTTHDVKGITQKDFDLIAKIDELG